jgi:hypothetical protein
MQRLGQLWRSLTGGQLTEYILIGMYSSVAILSLVVGLTAKAGTLFGRAVENANYGAKPELRAMLKQLLMASADFSAGASLLVIAAAIVYWGRRGKEAKGETLQEPVPPGPPFLF